MNGIVKLLLYAGLTFLTLYLGSYIMAYGIMMLLCCIALLVGSLLCVRIEATASRDALCSMTRRQRQLFHAQNLAFFSVIPPPVNDGGSHSSSFFRPWREQRWRKTAESKSEEMSECIANGQEFTTVIDGCTVKGGQWPSAEEVERCDNTIVLSVRGLWAGLAARINPVLNAFLNRYVKCWNRQLLYASIRLASYGFPYPVVTIDFPTGDPATLNFGQKDDCLVMSYIYEHVRTSYPKAKIILQSVCLGGLRILNWLARNPAPKNVIGVVLESPLPSVRHLLRGFLGSHFSEWWYRAFCSLLPNFRPELDGQYSFFQPRGSKAADLSKVPIFVGLIENDAFSNKGHLPLFADRFSNLTVFTTTADQSNHNITHGKLYRLPSYRAAVHTFVHALQREHACTK